ncbi:hypothetical protein M378DRAFT_84766, partial [Amanita muscaria Koide BX008]
MYILSGLAGIGKSTVAYTVASRAANLNLLGASFFFSRDDADRNNAKKLFTTIAYQLCVYNETFAKAIGDVLLTERGSAATTKDPQEQLQVLILDPLRSIVQSYARPILVVVDALDECDEEDVRAVVEGLSRLTIVSRYQSVVGAIAFVSHPLPVSTLAHLIDMDVEDIHALVEKLQSVILLGDDDVPRIYHKSFPDYLTDRARCKDPRLRIDPKIGHTQIATCCFKIMNQHLKYNILGLGDPARFMSNEDGLKKDRVTDVQLQAKMPQQLHYSCRYWANHLEVADVEDTDIVNRLEKFVDEHTLHWFEVLSLIGNLDSAHRAIRVVLKLLITQKPTSSNLHQFLSDALRFISKFYEIINRSALHTYYSALPFTPTSSLLYRRYIKEARHNICGIEGGPERWDALVANPNRGGKDDRVSLMEFGPDGRLFASGSMDGTIKLWNGGDGSIDGTIK